MADGEQQRADRSITIYDVARAAGVAPSTVSRAFSRPGRVNAETATRIHRIAEELGYRRNPLASALPTGRSGMLALVVTDVTNPVYAPIIRGAGLAAQEGGYTLLLHDTREDPETEREALERTVPVVEGIIMASSRRSDAALRTVASRRPMVVLNRAVSGVTSIFADNQRGMRRVAEHLGELGHETIHYLAGPETSWADGMRWQALQAAGMDLELKIRRVGPNAPTVAGGMAAVESLGDARPTAISAYNDLVAIGAMRALGQMRVVAPDEVSVVGFDNIFGSDFGTPALTTVASPLHAMGKGAVELLLERLGGGAPRTDDPVVLPVRLVVRDSTGPCREPHRRR
jgi:LacI family transcriptional regulator, repressor for deo operon, udp, cdd, tsx, nupC, and nupG